MTTADQLAIVNSWLGAECAATVLADGGLVQDWMKARRLLVVVECKGNQAIFVFITQNIPVTAVADLTLENVLPIDSEFKCDIDSGECAPDAVYVKISTGGKRHLLFEMLPGYHTQNLVAEIYRLTEASSTKGKELDFQWIRAFDDKIKISDELEPKSPVDAPQDIPGGATGGETPPDGILGNRTDIALGVTPIAARESVVKYLMAMKEDQFTEVQNFTVFCGTWNVNGQSPSPTDSVPDWLSCDDEPPDLYAIGFQELDLSKEAFLMLNSPKEEEWQRTVTESLHPKAKYKKIRQIRLVGMMLMVFVREEHSMYIQNIAAETVGTGIMGKLGNKGGVAVRFDFHNTSICVVDAHLAAHVSEYERRNQDYHEICNRMLFTGFTPPKTIKEHDMVYWLGDLNYRITELDVQTVKTFLNEGQMEPLMEYDQFKQQKFRRKVFVEYNEGPITFQPTYKYDPGTDVWDTSEKARAPAWTDRILWKGDHIKQKAYRSHMELKISDHKPVSSLFESGMKVVDQTKYRKIYEDVMKKLDKLENEFLPQVTVDTTELAFDTIRFIEPNSRTLTVANTGQVPVQFEFIKKLNDKSYCKPWLSVEPSAGFIMPGEKCDIAIEIYVDKKTAGMLTCGKDQMYDILVLHLIGGKDIFITVSGTYKRSCFGASINALVQMTVPIAELENGKLAELENSPEPPKSAEPYPVPKELWFLCDLISTLGLNQDQLFLQPGIRSELLLIRDWLDTGLPVDKPDVSIHSAAEMLLMFLESLREPIVPYNMYARCLEYSGNYLSCKQLVSQLPEHHKQVFVYMCAFLREVIRHSGQNGTDPKILATLFTSIFLRDPPGTDLGGGFKARANQQNLDSKKSKFIYHFLTNEPDD